VTIVNSAGLSRRRKIVAISLRAKNVVCVIQANQVTPRNMRGAGSKVWKKGRCCIVSDMSDKKRIPFADPRGDLAELRGRIIEVVTDVINSGSYVLGKEVTAIEQALAARFGTPGAVGVSSGTDALVLGLLASGVGTGDEVVTVSHTSGATAAAIRMIGAVPVFVDILEDTYCMDARKLEAAIGPRTKAILPVHMYGHPADLLAIGAVARRHGLSIVEDCAQAQEASIDGRSVGTIGNVGCFSFYPTKMLGALGDGGMVTSTESDLIDRLRLLRTYGWRMPQYSEMPDGRCSRLDEIQAAILRVKLDRLTQDVECRRKIAERYRTGLEGLPLTLPIELAGCRHVYHLYVVRCDRRDALASHLNQEGISTGIHYLNPVHIQPGLSVGSRTAGSLQTTEAIVGEILSLPIYPSLSDESQGRVIASVRRFFAQ
jgi:dTDP-4-amino-4,6-dideoxygalactose transaminase